MVHNNMKQEQKVTSSSPAQDMEEYEGLFDRRHNGISSLLPMTTEVV